MTAWGREPRPEPPANCSPASARTTTPSGSPHRRRQGLLHPVRLRGEITDIDPATGEIIRRPATGTMPDNVIYTPCGTRRASVCPACAETYRRDAYQIVKAGLDGGKGIPESVAAHPAIFATFTAPSFGPVHTRATGPGGKVLRCRPRRKKTICPHGRHLSCPPAAQGHRCLPRQTAVPGLLRLRRRRRLERPRSRTMAPHHDRPAPPPGPAGQATAPDQAVLRQSGRVPGPRRHPLPRPVPARRHTTPPNPHAAATTTPPGTADLADAIRHAAAATWFATVPHPAKPAGWDINWGITARHTAGERHRRWRHHAPRKRRIPRQIRHQGHRASRAHRRPHHRGQPSATTRQPPPTRAASSAPAGDSAPPPRRLPGTSPLGAHARLPRPLPDQNPPLLGHLQDPARRTRHLAATPEPTPARTADDRCSHRG